MSKRFLITTTLPYVNSDPHVGFAAELVRADIIARFERASGSEVVFNTGTDEHGLKIFRNAEAAGVTPQAYVDAYAKKFQELVFALQISSNRFSRTTNPDHKAGAQEFWKRCLAKGDIYKQQYEVKYCVGCELEKTDSELEDGKCPIHPNLQIEIIAEENYFFKFSKYQKELLNLYENYPDFVIPSFRLNEIRTFVEGGLNDFSISRIKEKMPWGIPVPGDDSQVMYVWFDALINYITCLDWPKEGSRFEEFWGTKEEPKFVQVCGKDNLRQQAAMWQSMLLSAGLPTSRQICVFGFITSGGHKMSKSLGNVIDPFQVISEYNSDALRFYVAHELQTYDDGDFTMEAFKESYNAYLANGIGNLTSRVLTMAISSGVFFVPRTDRELPKQLVDFLEKREIQASAHWLWGQFRQLDKQIQETEPFKLVKTDPEAANKIILKLVEELWDLQLALELFLPETAQKQKIALTELAALSLTKESIPKLFLRV